jgi:hypothetical protein
MPRFAKTGGREMLEEIKEIGSLQLQYSSENTPEMQRRGHLIRHELPEALQNYWGQFEAAIPKYAADLGVDASDGIGRKTQAPWVRLHSKELSPSATTGFYIVIHFASDGKKFFVTLGCGATKWDSDKGDLVKYSDSEIASKVLWARNIIGKERSSAFPDVIDLKSSYNLPRSFEKATVLCKTFDVGSAKVDEILSSISEVLELLSDIYDRYSEQNDQPESEIVSAVVDALVNPRKKNPNARQGYGLSGPDRKAVEIRAMEVVGAHLKSLGYKVKDTSSNKPFDYLAQKDGQEIKVEVKGTTSSNPDAVLMTANEVALHTDEKGNTALGIVSNISFDSRGANPKCSGGDIEFMLPWDISEWDLVPTSYSVVRRN